MYLHNELLKLQLFVLIKRNRKIGDLELDSQSKPVNTNIVLLKSTNRPYN